MKIDLLGSLRLEGSIAIKSLRLYLFIFVHFFLTLEIILANIEYVCVNQTHVILMLLMAH